MAKPTLVDVIDSKWKIVLSPQISIPKVVYAEPESQKVVWNFEIPAVAEKRVTR